MMLRLLWAVLLSSVAVSVAQPNDWLLSGNVYLDLVAWVPLFWALRRAPTPRAAALLGAIWGAMTILLQNYWLAFFKDYAFWTIGGVTLTFAGYCALLGPVLRLFLQRREPWRLFAVGALWAVFEYLKSNGFLGFPWGLAPYPLHQWNWFVQIVDITGLGFLSFLVVSWNAWLAECCEKLPHFPWKPSAKPVLAVGTNISFAQGLSFFLVITCGLAAYGIYRLNETHETRATARLVLVQQNGDPWNSGDDLGPLRSSVKLSREGLKNTGVDLVVWSETSIRLPLQYYRPFYERTPVEAPLLKTIRSSRAWWLLGNPYAQNPDEGTGWVNATVLLNPQAQIVNYYGKIQQVPLAEYVPFWDVPAVQSFFKSVVGLSGSWELGRQLTIYRVPINNGRQTMTFSTPICFEDAFPWLTRTMVLQGAEVLINLTNDSWSRRDSSQVQHQVAALFRAIESRVPLVRSTNSGVTNVIGADGNLLAGPLPFFKEGQLTVDIPLAKTRSLTPYTVLGDLIIYIFMGLLILDLTLLRRRLAKH